MDLLRDLSMNNEKKIVFFIMDGVGGLPWEKGGKTELETAKTPHLDALAADSECGLYAPLGIGITPGSAPGHLAVFGYHPLDYPIGRGVVAALGIGFDMKPGDVAARLNFATKDEEGRITDRRAGRIATEICAELCTQLNKIVLKDVEIFVKPVKDYRGVVVFRGPGLSDQVADTDPQDTGVPPLPPKGTTKNGEKMADLAVTFVERANQILQDQKPANTILMRGFAELPDIPSMRDRFKLNGVAMPVYPDYKGVSRLVGMDVIEGLKDLKDQGSALKENWEKYDFFFVHHKYTDSKGEDGDFQGKVKEIEKADEFLPNILALNPDVLLVTGDHSTPSRSRSHSGHPVPFCIFAEETRPDEITEFGERPCAKGLWGGVIDGDSVMRLALSYSGKLKKFGA